MTTLAGLRGCECSSVPFPPSDVRSVSLRLALEGTSISQNAIGRVGPVERMNADGDGRIEVIEPDGEPDRRRSVGQLDQARPVPLA